MTRIVNFAVLFIRLFAWPHRAFILMLCLITTADVLADESVWSQLRQGGLVVLIRHATTPSQFGDPPGMQLDDCATQRNLTDAGRDQAQRIGAAFAEQQVNVYEVRSSRLCRCLDTARLAFGSASPWDDITSITQDTPERRQQKAQSLKQLLGTKSPTPNSNLVVVTHNFNIQDATGVSIAMGEALVVRPKGDATFEVIGRIPPP